MIIDGKKISREILNTVQAEVSALSFAPKLIDVLVGEDPVTESYVRIKAKRAAEVGIVFEIIRFPAEVSQEELEMEIGKLNDLENICGVIVQLPLPVHLDRQRVLDRIRPEIDVDVIGTINSKKFYENNAYLTPPTAAAVIKMIQSLDVEVSGKNVLVVGAGDLVGRPVAFMLKNKNAEVIVVDKESKDIIGPALDAEIIISGTGVKNLIIAEMVNSDSIVIDAGTAESAGGIAGDADFENIKHKVRAISPVPGGVGPVTVAMLLKNVVEVAKSR
ncbi:MAG: bifunctional methylenetetrahydrofolate dehydrogenase/methenyltetrahydrofolate cyclohydrolase FolD [Candidatus Doudnabacteria bacterium]